MFSETLSDKRKNSHKSTKVAASVLFLCSEKVKSLCEKLDII